MYVNNDIYTHTHTHTQNPPIPPLVAVVAVTMASDDNRVDLSHPIVPSLIDLSSHSYQHTHQLAPNTLYLAAVSSDYLVL